MKEFTIDDLKIGDVFTIRDGSKIIIESDSSLRIKQMCRNLNLTHKFDPQNDIMKVERYVEYNGTLSTHNEIFLNTKCYRLETVYERKIEVPEENKKIEKINGTYWWDNRGEFSNEDYQENGRRIAATMQLISDKVDEIIDSVNKNK